MLVLIVIGLIITMIVLVCYFQRKVWQLEDRIEHIDYWRMQHFKALSLVLPRVHCTWEDAFMRHERPERIGPSGKLREKGS